MSGFGALCCLFEFAFIRYNAMIIEALAALQEPNGSEIGAICSFIEVV